jgi:hypothetical protein
MSGWCRSLRRSRASVARLTTRADVALRELENAPLREGTCSDGFRQKVCRGDRKGKEPQRPQRGKLNGAIAAQPPRAGESLAVDVRPMFSRPYPIMSDGVPQATSTHSMPRRTLPRTPRSFLPCWSSEPGELLEVVLEKLPESQERTCPRTAGCRASPGRPSWRPRRQGRDPGVDRRSRDHFPSPDCERRRIGSLATRSSAPDEVGKNLGPSNSSFGPASASHRRVWLVVPPENRSLFPAPAPASLGPRIARGSALRTTLRVGTPARVRAPRPARLFENSSSVRPFRVWHRSAWRCRSAKQGLWNDCQNDSAEDRQR